MLDDLDAVLDERSFYEVVHHDDEPGSIGMLGGARDRLRGVRNAPEMWDYTRGRRQPTLTSRRRDPLVSRILDLRQADGRELRRQIDVLTYGAHARRIERLKRKAVLTEGQQAQVDAHDAALGELRAQLHAAKAKAR